MEIINNKPKFKLITFADNKNGNKIFCRFTMNKKTLIKGYYDFNKELFFITQYNKNNFTENVNHNTAKNILKEILIQDYDWILKE